MVRERRRKRDPGAPRPAPFMVPLPRAPARRMDKVRLSERIRAGAMTRRDEEWLRNVNLPSSPAMRIYTAKELRLDDDRFLHLKFAQNTVSDADYLTIQYLCSDGSLFRITNLLNDLIMGTGFHAELELIDPSGDPEKDEAAMGRPEREAVNMLAHVDRHVGRHGQGLWPTLHSAISQLNKLTICYNRGAIIMHDTVEGGKAPEWKGKEVKGVPQGLQVVNPRDLGMVAINEQNIPVGIYRQLVNNELLEMDSMMYVHNAEEGVHVHNSYGFGLPLTAGAISAARVLDKLLQEDMPTASRVSWTGQLMVIVDMEGGELEQKQEILADMLGNFQAGGAMGFSANPDDVEVVNVDYKAQIGELVNLATWLDSYIRGEMGISDSAMAERDSSRASGQASQAINQQGGIEPRRERLGRLLADRWYTPILEKNMPEVAKKWRVRVVFDDLDTESMAQRVEAANGVMASFRIKAREYGKIAGIRDLDKKIDHKRQKTLLESEKNESMNDRMATGGSMSINKSGSSKKRNVSRPDEVMGR